MEIKLNRYYDIPGEKWAHSIGISTAVASSMHFLDPIRKLRFNNPTADCRCITNRFLFTRIKLYQLNNSCTKYTQIHAHGRENVQCVCVCVRAQCILT